MSTANFFQMGARAWSYRTAITDVLPDGRTIGNASKYSVTTSKHQRAARVTFCDITVSDVPMGTENLAEWYWRGCIARFNDEAALYAAHNPNVEQQDGETTDI